MGENQLGPLQAFQKPDPPLFIPVPLRLWDKPQICDAVEESCEFYRTLVYFMHSFPFNGEQMTVMPDIFKLEETPDNSDKGLAEQAASGKKQCPICSQAFVSFKGMKQHLGKVHPTTVKAVLCNFCTKEFKNKYALQFHIKQVHEKQTRVLCTVCGKQLYNKYILKKHMKDRHFVN